MWDLHWPLLLEQFLAYRESYLDCWRPFSFTFPRIELLYEPFLGPQSENGEQRLTRVPQHLQPLSRPVHFSWEGPVHGDLTNASQFLWMIHCSYHLLGSAPHPHFILQIKSAKLNATVRDKHISPRPVLCGHCICHRRWDSSKTAGWDKPHRASPWHTGEWVKIKCS